LIDGKTDKKLINEIASSIALNCFEDIIPPNAKVKRDGLRYYAKRYILFPIYNLFNSLKGRNRGNMI
jgi:hypothetical protein